MNKNELMKEYNALLITYFRSSVAMADAKPADAKLLKRDNTDQYARLGVLYSQLLEATCAPLMNDLIVLPEGHEFAGRKAIVDSVEFEAQKFAFCDSYKVLPKFALRGRLLSNVSLKATPIKFKFEGGGKADKVKLFIYTPRGA